MNIIEEISSFYPNLSNKQKEQFSSLKDIYSEWNSKINVISRKDIYNFDIHHLLHAISIARVIHFLPNTKVLDIGTGGGFPGIPLAILFPETQFHLVDSIGKKIHIVEQVIKTLDIKNVTTEKVRAEMLSQKYDFIVCRAVARLNTILHWVRNKVNTTSYHKIKNGILCLKGGNLQEELAETKLKYTTFPIRSFFDYPYFETKQIVYISIDSIQNKK